MKVDIRKILKWVALIAVLIIVSYEVVKFIILRYHKQNPPIPEVSIQTISIADAPFTFEYSGRSVGVLEVDVRAQVSGILLKKLYIEGQFVKQGETLFQIDPAPFQAAFNKATGELK